MKPLEIQFALRERGVQQQHIASELHVSGMAVSLTIWRKTTSDRIMRAIAAALCKDHRLVFPEYYLAPIRAAHRQTTFSLAIRFIIAEKIFRQPADGNEFSYYFIKYSNRVVINAVLFFDDIS